MFTENDFDTFLIDGLDERMKAIKERIQPKFKKIGTEISDDLAALVGNEMHLHIAKHARRTVNPPKDTWLAVCHDKRGYKKHPHFQLGLFDDHVFVWFALIYELPHKKLIAQTFLDNVDTIDDLIPDDYVISLDHMKKDALNKSELSKLELSKYLEKFRDVKKTEFLVGKHIRKGDPILENETLFLSYIKDIYNRLIPLYNLSFKSI